MVSLRALDADILPRLATYLLTLLTEITAAFEPDPYHLPSLKHTIVWTSALLDAHCVRFVTDPSLRGFVQAAQKLMQAELALCQSVLNLPGYAVQFGQKAVPVWPIGDYQIERIDL